MLLHGGMSMNNTSRESVKRYKALILDVDGTLIPKKRDGTPSKRVIEAIAKIRDFIVVGVATSRPYFMLSHITNVLSLSGPSIINGGAQIIDLPSGNIPWEMPLEKKDVVVVSEIINSELAKLKMGEFWINSGEEDISYKRGTIPEKALQLYTEGLTPVFADKVFQKLYRVSPTIAVYKVPCWNEGKMDLIITHAEATKQHGIFEVAKILGISTHEIIAVGDGHNDFPLLMACGLKVAMGNAVEDLKAIADYVAPSVEDDGVADVINRFVLN